MLESFFGAALSTRDLDKDDLFLREGRFFCVIFGAVEFFRIFEDFTPELTAGSLGGYRSHYCRCQHGRQ